MRTLVPALALVVGIAAGVLLGELRQDAHAQGQGGGKGSGGGGANNVACTIDSVTGVAFGIYDEESAAAQPSSGQLNFSCKPKNKPVTVKITIGPSTVTGSITDRAMQQAGGGDSLHYNLFQDSRGSVIWGDDAAGGSSMVLTGADSFSVEIFGYIYPSQDVTEDIYADTLQISIQF